MEQYKSDSDSTLYENKAKVVALLLKKVIQLPQPI